MANRSRESRRRAGRGRSTVRRAHRRDRPRRRRPRRDWPRGRPASPRGSAPRGRRAGGPQARGCRRRARTGAGTAKGNVDRTDQVDARAGNAREGDRGAQRVAALVRAVEGHADGRERQLSLLKSRGCDGDRPGRSVEEALRRAAGRCVQRVRGWVEPWTIVVASCSVARTWSSRARDDARTVVSSTWRSPAALRVRWWSWSASPRPQPRARRARRPNTPSRDGIPRPAAAPARQGPPAALPLRAMSASASRRSAINRPSSADGRRFASGQLRAADSVVLELPRGGVPVAVEVARAFGAPRDVILVHKVGVPRNPEFAIGAIGEDARRRPSAGARAPRASSSYVLVERVCARATSPTASERPR